MKTDNKFLLVDSREKPKAIAGILDYFDREGIQHATTKLLFGDYMDYNRPGLVIDRKRNVAELAKNCTSEHKRFRNELERVRTAGATLVILVEQNRYKDRGEWRKLQDIDDLIFWTSPHTKVTGETVFRILSGWQYKYPVRVEFCDKRSTGRRITEILYGREGGHDERGRKEELHNLHGRRGDPR